MKTYLTIIIFPLFLLGIFSFLPLEDGTAARWLPRKERLQNKKKSALQKETVCPHKNFKGRKASVVLDPETGTIYGQISADEIRYPASLVKMMTLYLVFEALESGQLKLTDHIRISENAASKCPFKLGVRAGDRITVGQAIRGICTHSANDAATAVAEHLAGSEAAFAARMTAKARDLGMLKTVFKNAKGLPHPEQVTTARDFARLAMALFHHFPKYYHFFSEKTFTFRGTTYHNTNNLLKDMDGVNGIKTGYTPYAGHALAASIHKEGRRVIAIVLGASSRTDRNRTVRQMLESAFDKPRHGPHKEIVHRDRTKTFAELMQHLNRPSPQSVMIPSAAKAPILPPHKPSFADQNVVVEGMMVDFEEAEMPLPAADRADGNPLRNWKAQVGSFPTPGQAERHLKTLQKKYPAALGALRTKVVPGKHGNKTYYKSRFMNLTEAEAAALEETFRRDGVDYFLIPPV